MSKLYEQACMLAKATSDAWSAGRYYSRVSWRACAKALLSQGYTYAQAEAILRSKVTRYAADHANARHGCATSRDLIRFLELPSTKRFIAELFVEVGVQ